jgi:hypothetical protein
MDVRVLLVCKDEAQIHQLRKWLGTIYELELAEKMLMIANCELERVTEVIERFRLSGHPIHKVIYWHEDITFAHMNLARIKTMVILPFRQDYRPKKSVGDVFITEPLTVEGFSQATALLLEELAPKGEKDTVRMHWRNRHGTCAPVGLLHFVQ